MFCIQNIPSGIIIPSNLLQIILWLVLWWKPIPIMVILSKMFFAGGFFFFKLINLLTCIVILCIHSAEEICYGRCFVICGTGVCSLRWKVIYISFL